MIIWYAEETNNCGALGKYRTSQVNISCWKNNKGQLQSLSYTTENILLT
jgi:hypothetical protein